MSKAAPKAKPLPKLGDSFILPDRSVGVVSGVSWLHPERDVIRRMVSIDVVPVSVPVTTGRSALAESWGGVLPGVDPIDLAQQVVRFAMKAMIYVGRPEMEGKLVKMKKFIPLHMYPRGVVLMPNEIGAIGGVRFIRGKPETLTQKRLTLINNLYRGPLGSED